MFLYSLILSKTTTVSFNEYPITVRTAAINAWFISILKGIILYASENIPKTTITSWKTAETAPSENCQFLNLISMYRKTKIKEPITAMNEFVLISSAMVGPTLIDDIMPTDLFSSPLTNES